MGETTDLQAENNRFHRLFEKFSAESKALTIASVALIITVLSLLMAFMALDAAKNAKIRAQYQDQIIEDLSDEFRLYQYHAEAIHADLTAHGFKPPPLPEK